MTASQFPSINNLIHLNHAAVAPWPRVTADSINAFTEENLQQGSLNYPQWLQVESELRKRLASLINARSSDEIALLKNTSEGLSLVAQGVAWNMGDNVVGIQQEFPSNRLPWLSLKDQGVTFRQLDLDACMADAESALFALCDERTRLISVSAVQYANGFRMNLDRIGAYCRENGILFCVDAIQQVGCLQFDVQQVKADFVIADGHKWLLAPEGLALFYIRKECIGQLRLTQHGWHMTSHPGDYSKTDYAPATTARRFECGSPNMLGIHALHASTGLLLETGMETVEHQVTTHISMLEQGLRNIDGVALISDMHPERRSGIITFRSKSIENEQLHRFLQDHGIFCALRGGGIRFSPHYYTPENHLHKALALVEDACRKGNL